MSLQFFKSGVGVDDNVAASAIFVLNLNLDSLVLVRVFEGLCGFL